MCVCVCSMYSCTASANPILHTKNTLLALQNYQINILSESFKEGVALTKETTGSQVSLKIRATPHTVLDLLQISD